MINAFNYMFKDNRFAQKAGIYFILVFVSQVFLNYANTFNSGATRQMLPADYYIFAFIGTVLNLIPLGYGISCIRALIEQKDTSVVPFVNIKNNLWQGFKYSIAILILTVAFICLTMFAILIFAFIANLLNIQAFLGIIVGLLTVTPIIFIFIYALAFSWIFATTESWTSFLKIKKATLLIKENKATYWKSLGLFVLVILMFIIPFFIVGTIITTTIPNKFIYSIVISIVISMLSVYTTFVSCYITAKSIKTQA